MVRAMQEQGLSMKYQIEMMPTLIFFKKGKILERVIGFKTEEDLRKLVAKYK
jgi:thioredoxin-like negative regulator of GroEL